MDLGAATVHLKRIAAPNRDLAVMGYVPINQICVRTGAQIALQHLRLPDSLQPAVLQLFGPRMLDSKRPLREPLCD